MSNPKLLFICTANINRSKTAEDLFQGSDKYDAQSAGIIRHRLGGQMVNQELINWADRIFVMNEATDCHLTKLNSRFNTEGKRVDVLDIPDIYSRSDPSLIELLKSRLASFGIFI